MPTQQAVVHIRPRCSRNIVNFTGEKGLVKPSVGCLSIGMYKVEIHPNLWQSQINLYFELICFEHLLIFPVVMRLIADWLLEWSRVGKAIEIWIEPKKLQSYSTSWYPVVAAINSTSVEDIKTQACLCKAHIIALPERQITKPVIDFQCKGTIVTLG